MSSELIAAWECDFFFGVEDETLESTLGIVLVNGTMMYLQDDVPTEPFNPTQDRWWRIDVGDEVITAFTSADGNDWEEQRAAVTLGWASELRLRIHAGCYEARAGFGSIQLDNLNLPPSRCPP